jgi:hypothetical protein
LLALTTDYAEVSSIVAFISSLAIALGAVFVVLQIRDNKKLILASTEQAKAAVIQAKLSTDQLTQNNDLADMEMIMRIYEFANTAEVQSSWLTVIDSKLKSYEEFERLSKVDRVSFYQIAALFESIGVLVDKGFVSLQTIDDMFSSELAWLLMKPFVDGINTKAGDEVYVFFRKLIEGMKSYHENPAAMTKGTNRSIRGQRDPSALTSALGQLG